MMSKTSAAAFFDVENMQRNVNEMRKDLPQRVKAGVALSVGGLFGFALDRGLVNVPVVIRSQFTFSSFIMLRMFLAASITSTIVVTVLETLGLVKRKPKPCTQLNALDNTLIGGNVLGGLFLGSGMALTGSCPGTIWSQLGARPTVSRLMTLFGALLGCFLYAIVKDNQGFDISLGNMRELKLNLYKISSENRRHFSYAFIVCASLFVAGLNILFPWENEVGRFANVTSQGILSAAWDPVVSGAMIGLLQLPSLLVLENGLGASSGWMHLASYVNTDQVNSDTLESSKKSTKAQLQLIQSFGGILGGFLSHHLASQGMIPRLTTYGTEDSGLFINLLGGIFLLFGARLAGGCTSGHGLTGIANMGFSSFVTVAAMFGGAIATALLM